MSKSEKIRQYLRENPGARNKEVSEALGVSIQLVSIAGREVIRRRKADGSDPTSTRVREFISFMFNHPEMSSSQLAEALGTTVPSVRYLKRLARTAVERPSDSTGTLRNGPQ